VKYVSICSGIEAATVAWHPLGWKPVAFSEIEPFPCAVLKHHYPDVPNLGDMTRCDEWGIENGIDVLVGGTPCQSFSLAGNRGGMDDPRGQLAVKFFDIVRKCKPTWIVWENVPGVLSSNKGRDFGLFLSEMGKCGYGFAYRILDAQYFGVAQRRRRVFVVGYLGDWRPSAAVLFERQSLCGDFKKGRKKKQGASTDSGLDSETKCLSCGIMWEPDGGLECCPICGASQGYCPDKAATLETTSNDYSRADGFCMIAGPMCKSFTVADVRRRGTIDLHDTVQTLTSQTKRGDTEPCVMYHASRRDSVRVNIEISPTIESQWGTGGNNVPNIVDQNRNLSCCLALRRLTPRECERLQGFPDDHTAISWRGRPSDSCPDGPRYKALGNSMAVPVMRWIGQRIEMVSKVVKK
jgi:DNA (cytosine-5)-methyltransferase 1